MDGYKVYFGSMLFPVAPEKISTRINGKNKVYELINEGEMNVLKLAGLSTVSFSVLLPAVKYPFAVYPDGYKQPSHYLEELERLKQSKRPFQFIISRHEGSGMLTNMHNTNMTVSLESYQIQESAQNGCDITVDIDLKQYREFKTKTFTVETPKNTGTVQVKTTRQQSTVKPPQNQGADRAKAAQAATDFFRKAGETFGKAAKSLAETMAAAFAKTGKTPTGGTQKLASKSMVLMR